MLFPSATLAAGKQRIQNAVCGVLNMKYLLHNIYCRLHVVIGFFLNNKESNISLIITAYYKMLHVVIVVVQLR